MENFMRTLGYRGNEELKVEAEVLPPQVNW